jgi:hypothetical protein
MTWFTGICSSRRSVKVLNLKPLKKKGQSRTFRLEEEWLTKTEIADSQIQSRLMMLPFEIRDQIWLYCLGGMAINLDIDIHRKNYRQFSTPHRGLLSVALCCRQM